MCNMAQYVLSLAFRLYIPDFASHHNLALALSIFDIGTKSNLSTWGTAVNMNLRWFGSSETGFPCSVSLRSSVTLPSFLTGAIHADVPKHIPHMLRVQCQQ